MFSLIVALCAAQTPDSPPTPPFTLTTYISK